LINSQLFINFKIWNRLINSWENKRFPHSILFHGPAGSGKEGHALELAAYINCLESNNNQSCGKCSSCIKIKMLQHENVKIILPLPRGKLKSSTDPIEKAFTDKVLKEYKEMINIKKTNPYYSINLSGANTILINSIRSIKKDISLSTINNEWKVIIIFQAEKLCIPSSEAANSLLKILEEPPSKTLFILVSSFANSIIDTIHSRCQKIYFSPIPKEIIHKKLIKDGTDSMEAEIITKISNGNINLAYELNNNTSDLLQNLFLLLNACFSKNPVIWNNSINNIIKLKSNNTQRMQQVFYCAKLFFRDLFYYSNSSENNQIIFQKYTSKIDSLTKKYYKADWYICIEHISNTQNYITKNGYVPLQLICMFQNINNSLIKKTNQIFDLDDWIN